MTSSDHLLTEQMQNLLDWPSILQEIKSKPELNGCMVRVLQHIHETNRWKVQFIDDMTGQPKSRPEGGGDGTISVTPDKLVTEAEFWKNSWRRSGWDV